MIPVQYNTLEGLKLSILNYASVEEGDTAAGKPGAILQEANRNLTYRGALAIGRSALVEALIAETGIAFKVKTVTKKNAKGEDETETEPDETEGVYVKRCRAEKGMTGNDAAWLAFAQPIADKVSQTGDEGKPLAVDIKEPDRTGKPKSLPANYKNAAERIFTNNNQDHWRTKFGLPEWTGDRVKDVETLGWAIRKDALAKQKEQEMVYV